MVGYIELLVEQIHRIYYTLRFRNDKRREQHHWNRVWKMKHIFKMKWLGYETFFVLLLLKYEMLIKTYVVY